MSTETPLHPMTTLRLEILADEEVPIASDGTVPPAPEGLQAQETPSSTPASASAMPQRIRGGRRPPRIETVEGRISAQAVLERFRENRAEWYSATLDPFVAGIERQLEEEARLSAVCEGLPGADHPDVCQACSSLPGQSAPSTDRLHIWHPEIWWISPIVRYRDTPLNLRVPLAQTSDGLVRELAEHLPEAWRNRKVVVQIEVETHIYWGGCGLRGAPEGGPQSWTPCSFRGDGVGASKDLLQFRKGQVTWLTQDPKDAEGPLIQRTLRPGVGLLVAVPVVSFELQENSVNWLMRQARRALRWLGWKQPLVDRDPTFERRLKSDEHYWAQALGTTVPSDADLAIAVKKGARLAAASRPAVDHRVDAPMPPSTARHVVLVHGGLSSVHGGWSAWLGSGVPAGACGPWQTMPLLNEHCVWRFEHDTFLRIDRNINQLVDALERQVIGPTEEGTLVLLAHSRGGNVVRFALQRLRRRWPRWQFHALTAGSPHLGTKVFLQIGRRWSGASVLVGLFRDLASGVLDKQQMTDLLILERALAYEIPPGFRDVEPDGVKRMAKGQPLPEGLVAWGSEWAPPRGRPVEDGIWHRIVEDWAGFEADGDGLVPLHSSRPAELPQTYDASPVFHTGYFAHPDTAAQIRQALEQRLSGQTPAPA